jgi:hypothetical protein
MILHLFVTLFEKRNVLIEKLNKSDEKSGELQFKIHQIDMEILRKQEFYFGRLTQKKQHEREKWIPSSSFNRVMPKKIHCAIH